MQARCLPLACEEAAASCAVLQVDSHALLHGKRCILWDDQGAGFFMVSPHFVGLQVIACARFSLPGVLLLQMMNWDWLTNQPAQRRSPDDTDPGW